MTVLSAVSLIIGIVGTVAALIVATLTIVGKVKEKAHEDSKSSTLFALIQKDISTLVSGQCAIGGKVETLEKTVNNHESRISVLEKITEEK